MEAYFCHGIKNTCNVLSNNSEFVSCKYCMRNKLGSAQAQDSELYPDFFCCMQVCKSEL